MYQKLSQMIGGNIDQWRIQDFPEGGAWTLQGGREHAKFSRKLHEIERIWTPRGGRASLTPPPRSANVDNALRQNCNPITQIKFPELFRIFEKQ